MSGLLKVPFTSLIETGSGPKEADEKMKQEEFRSFHSEPQTRFDLVSISPG